MKMKIVKQFSVKEPKVLESVVLSLHVDKANCLTHNHTREFSDTIKINSFVMDAAGEQVAQGYEVAWVNRILQGVKWSDNLKALKLAGGIHLELKDVHNAGAEWKKRNPDERIGDTQDPWPQQWSHCLEALRKEDDVLSEAITATRAIDKMVAHGIVFAKKSEYN